MMRPSRRIFDSDSSYSCHDSEQNEQEYSDYSESDFGVKSLQRMQLDTDKVIENAGFIPSELRTLILNATLGTQIIPKSDERDIYFTIVAATTLRMQRILERSLKLAKLRNINPENANVAIKDIPTLPFSILNAEQNVSNGVTVETTSDDAKVQKFVREVSSVSNEVAKLPKSVRNYPDGILGLVPHNTRNPEITKADILAALEAEKGTGWYKYKYSK